MRIRIAAVVSLAVLASAAWAGEAGAHKKSFKSIVDIDTYKFSGEFGGVVNSFENKRCARERVIALWRRNPGAMDAPMGTARSGDGGRWAINVTATPAVYYATAKKRVLFRKKGKHFHFCRFARSAPFEIGF